MSDVVLVALFGTIGTLGGTLLTPWIESRREKRREQRDDRQRLLAPYLEAYRAFSAAIADVDRAFLIYAWGRTSEGLVFPKASEEIGNGRGVIISMNPRIGSLATEAADAISAYHLTLINGWKQLSSQSEVEAARHTAHDALDRFAQEYRNSFE